MPTTFAQRQAEIATLMAAGLGLEAYADEIVDKVWVKDPTFHAPANATDVVVWTEDAGGAAASAYGL